VLFSEPKIPQLVGLSACRRRCAAFQCSSASRKFLNLLYREHAAFSYMFQCSSASRKFLNPLRRRLPATICPVSVLFSEPKIPQCGCGTDRLKLYLSFQCSSASRKFLNFQVERFDVVALGVSVLFSEPKIPQSGRHVQDVELQRNVSVLFSEPKIPQWVRKHREYDIREVSVLFSEPKIPQSSFSDAQRPRWTRFSALQRAENSSIQKNARCARVETGFSALQRAENSSIEFHAAKIAPAASFSALQRAENSSIVKNSTLSS